MTKRRHTLKNRVVKRLRPRGQRATDCEQKRRYRVDLPAGMYQQIREFLFTGRRQERLGVILAGISRVGNEVRLLGREFVPAEGKAVDRASVGSVVGSSSFSQYIMERCAKTGLCQIDCHSHPFGGSDGLWFSGVDDRAETKMADYIYRHLPQSIYASLVFDEIGERGRVWCAGRPPTWQAMESIRIIESPLHDLDLRPRGRHETMPHFVRDAAFDRQIQTFGEVGQARMHGATITVIGAGGLGSIVIEGLARLGFVAINIVEPDYAEVTNLNRVVGMRFQDAVSGRPKVEIAARTVEEINPKAIVSIYRSSVFDPSVLTALKQSDLIVVATDSHSSRMFCQRVAAQYLLPLLHVGVNIDAEGGQLVDVSGEYALALPGPGGWCLSCAAAFDSQQASWELAPAIDQARWVERGYVRGPRVAAPSVRHLNGVVADLALAEVHNLFSPYREPRTYVAYDGLRCEITAINIGRDPRCAICSENGVLGMGDLESLPEFNQRHEFTFPEPPYDHTCHDECYQREIAGYLGYAPHK